MDHILGQLLCYLTLPQDIPCGGSGSGSYTATGGQHETQLDWTTILGTGTIFFLFPKTGYKFFGIIFYYSFLLLCCFFSYFFFVYS